ncbi:unnamed protein product [Durusdinium trenchii]|uniref:Amino acid transporter transmembrane domain-containing protein n=1 Tax=Durusdinium trenchii TaxID=1381693 RepID=A0ABP0SIW4_9DINO
MALETKAVSVDLESSVSEASTTDSPIKASEKFQRQSSFRRGGVIPTAICLSKATISVGVLSMSVHAAEVGALYQLACLMLGGVLTVLSIRMISVASIETKKWSFEDVCEELFHPVMAIVTGFMNACVCLGSAAGYLIVCGQVFVVVFPTDDATRNLFVVSVGIFVCCPMALARHVGFTRHLAAMTVGALILLVIVVAWYMGEHRIDESVTTESFLLGPGEATFVAYMNSINNMIFAYNNQFNVPQLTRELTHEPSRDGMTKVAILSTSVTFLLYALVFLLSVLAFGVAENQKDSLILDLMPVREEIHVRISLMAVMFSVLTCFQLHIYPIQQFLAYLVRKARGCSSDDEKADVVYFGRSLTRWYDIFCALGSVCLVVLIAVVITSLRAMLDFIGAFGAAYISFMVPPMWIIALRRKDEQNFSWFNKEILWSVSFLALGLFLFVFGTYSAILPILGL